MTCPFAKFHSDFTTSNEVTEDQKLSYKIYDMEAEILRTTKRLEKLRETRKRLEVEGEMKRAGTVENVEKEFNRLFGSSRPTNAWTPRLTQMKPLLTSIVYTLKNLEARLNEGKVHVHDENIPLKFVELPKPSVSAVRVPTVSVPMWTCKNCAEEWVETHLNEEVCKGCGFMRSDDAPPPPSLGGAHPRHLRDDADCPGEMDKIWARHEFEIGDEELVAEVLSGLSKVPSGPIEFNPKDGYTYCSDKPNDSFTFDKKD
jgi:hypothetical protein